MNRYFSGEILRRIESAGIMAVLVFDDAGRAAATARALVEGGVDVMELALRTPASFEALANIRREVPEMLAGVGTVLAPEQIRQAMEAGARFGVAPGFQDRVVGEALAQKFPFAPGVLTPSDLERALSFGCRTLKLFPAENIGGVPYLKSLYAPYAHLGVRFIPLGGVTPGNMGLYLREESVLAVGGSWLAPKRAISAGDLDFLRRSAHDARRKVTDVRAKKG